MFSESQLALYIATVFIVVVVPGPDVLYVVSQAGLGGPSRGLYAILGINAGFCVHVCVAIAGLSLFLMHSQSVFLFIREAGAIYLIYLGLSRLFWFAKPAQALPDTESAPVQRPSSAFWNGFFTNVSNPKAALFTYSLLPQFITPARGAIAFQILVLAACAAAIGMTVLGVYALCASSLLYRFRGSKRANQVERYGIGSLFLGLGVRFLISR